MRFEELVRASLSRCLLVAKANHWVRQVASEKGTPYNFAELILSAI